MTAPLAVKRVPLEGLVLDPANARLHGDRNMDAIKASLSRFGQVEPLVVREGTNVVIGGNGRLAAMRELGWREADVAFIDLDETKAKALAIALNRTAELAEWDYGYLKDVLLDLSAADVDISYLGATGFDEVEIKDLLLGAPGFTPGSEDDQSQLDEKNKISCPNCAHVFTA